MRDSGGGAIRIGPILGVIAALTLIAFPGCGEELGPEAMPTARVSGTVRVGRTPVGGGWIEFLPVDGTIGLLESARLGPDGAFVAGRVPVGRVGIRLVHPPFPLPCGRNFERVFLIRREIPDTPMRPFDIELIQEAERHCP